MSWPGVGSEVGRVGKGLGVRAGCWRWGWEGGGGGRVDVGSGRIVVAIA